jgi:hypothetical protein
MHGQRQLGYNDIKKYHISNDIYNILIRRHFGVEIIDGLKKTGIRKCRKCNEELDEYGDHALRCKIGKGPIYRHDMVNKFLYNNIQQETRNIKIEPRNTNVENEERPDLIIWDEIEYADGKYSKIFVDTMITDIYKKQNVQMIKQRKFKIFNAGKLAEKVKKELYSNKFNDLKQNGYKFIPSIFESYGGIGKT